MNSADAVQLAIQELKRADHSIAVSLKYTRTVDVMRSIIERLINTISFCIDALLHKAKENKRISEVTTVPKLKLDEAKRVYVSDDKIRDFCEFYQLLRRIHAAKFLRSQEYRRHVTMTSIMEDGKKIEVTIDIITDYYERVKEFLNYTMQIIEMK